MTHPAPLTSKELARLRELLEKATPGPWCGALLFTENHTEANYELVDAAVSALPRLIAQAERTRQLEEALEQIAAFNVGVAEDRREISKYYTMGFNNAGLYASGIAKAALSKDQTHD